MTQAPKDALLALVESYFTDHLQRVQGASPHTVRAYRDALKLIFLFLSAKTSHSIDHLRLDDVTVENVLAFLEHIEAERKSSRSTRNCRLTALRSFVHHLLRHDIARARQYQRILASPSKKARMRRVSYLEPEEMKVVVAQPDQRTTAGIRDRALLLLLYNTGARVSEVLEVRPKDLQLRRPRRVRLFGKGRKERVCPLWPETAVVLQRLLKKTRLAEDSPIFRNARGLPLSRDGVAYVLQKYVNQAGHVAHTLRKRKVTPHQIRHSTAVALLQAGADITVIRDYLGHASVATTSRYITTNLQMKQDVLNQFWERAGLKRVAPRNWHPKPSLLAFLTSL